MSHCFEICYYQQNVPPHYYLLDTLVIYIMKNYVGDKFKFKILREEIFLKKSFVPAMAHIVCDGAVHAFAAKKRRDLRPCLVLPTLGK